MIVNVKRNTLWGTKNSKKIKKDPEIAALS